MKDTTFAVIGLGLMGSRMSARLLGDGFAVRGFDVDPARLEDFAKVGGHTAASPAQAVQGCRAVLLSLPTAEISREVCLGTGGIVESGVSPLFVYDTTTGRPRDAVEIATELARWGIVYSDATVSGNGEVAEQGQLVVMVGGTPDAYRSGKPIFESIGRTHHHIGPVGSGSRMKLIVNHVLTIHRMALAEALVVAEVSGADLTTTLAVLKDSMAYSRAIDAWGDRMIEADHERPFARLKQSHKDARLIVEHGIESGAPVDLVKVVEDALAEGELNGLGDFDNSSIVEVIRRRAGIGRIG